jgi:hypothetical protein
MSFSLFNAEEQTARAMSAYAQCAHAFAKGQYKLD